jgi:hypothetical protein
VISLALATAAQTLSFSCVVDPPRNVIVKGQTVSSTAIGLPPELNQWKFDLTLRDSEDAISVTMDWPGDPITAGKAVAAISEGRHDYAFVSLNPGPCLFTVTACMLMYTISQQTDGTADILIQPSALGTDGDRSKPFQVFMTGRCQPKVVAK